MSSVEQVTRLLRSWKSGDRSALDELTPIVYDELRRLAAHYLRSESAAATLQPTAYRKQRSTLVCQVTGGPCRYEGKDMLKPVIVEK